MDKATLALLVSFGSLAVALAGLFWRIQRDAFSRPKVRLTSGITYRDTGDRKLEVNVFNSGPGSVIVRAPILRFRIRSLIRSRAHLYLPASSITLEAPRSLPTEIPPDGVLTFHMDWEGLEKLVRRGGQFGVEDSYGRRHMLRHGSLLRYFREYPAAPSGQNADTDDFPF